MGTARGHLEVEQAAASRAVKRLFRLLEVAPERDLRFVFDAIVACGRRNPAQRDETERGEQWLTCRSSLAEAADRLGYVPSKPRYITWRADQVEPGRYATGSAILRILGQGKWRAAAETLEVPKVDVTAGRLLSNGKRFSVEECWAALKLFADAVSPEGRTMSRYGTWAIDHVRAGGSGRVPLNSRTLIKRLRRSWSDLRDDLAAVTFGEVNNDDA